MASEIRRHAAAWAGGVLVHEEGQRRHPLLNCFKKCLFCLSLSRLVCEALTPSCCPNVGAVASCLPRKMKNVLGGETKRFGYLRVRRLHRRTGATQRVKRVSVDHKTKACRGSRFQKVPETGLPIYLTRQRVQHSALRVAILVAACGSVRRTWLRIVRVSFWFHPGAQTRTC